MTAPETKLQFNVYLPAELVRAIKHRAIDEGTSLSALVEKVMRRHLSGAEPAPAEAAAPPADGELVVLPVWYPRDLEATERLVRALGLQPRIASDSGNWRDVRADGGGLVALHADADASNADPDPAPTRPRTELSFEYRGDLDAFADRLEQGGFETVVVDEAYNRTLLVTTPDGWQLWINEAQTDLHGFRRAD